jgi:hypothetical protein
MYLMRPSGSLKRQKLELQDFFFIRLIPDHLLGQGVSRKNEYCTETGQNTIQPMLCLNPGILARKNLLKVIYIAGKNFIKICPLTDLQVYLQK